MKLPLLALPLAAALPTAPSTNYARAFTLVAARSGSPIHLQPLVASGMGLWIGANTSAYCPAPPVPDCADYTNSTALACGDPTGHPSGCSMSVAVPGGQAVFVDGATGAIGYTAAHSAQEPPGAIASGFTYKRALSPDEFGQFSFVGNGSQGLLACSHNEGCDETTGDGCAPWQVVADLPGVQRTGCCLGFDALTYGTNITAWQYA